MSDTAAWLALVAVAVATSIVSGVMGLAGGMLLLSALLLRLDPLVAIPVHGVVQLVSNASRAWFQRRHVRWDAVWRFAWPLLPAGAAGLALLRSVPPDAGRLGIGLFVLALELGPQASIGTIAACQIFQHGSKLALFGAAGFDFARYALPLAGLCAGAVAGSAIGTRLLDRLPERAFRLAVRLLLSALALELVLDGVH